MVPQCGRPLLALAMILGVCGGCAPLDTRDMLRADQCPTPSFDTSEYLIGPGDTLEVVVWRNEELSGTLPVRPDGRISTPLVDDMVASGKTPSQLASDMENVLSEYLRTPQVSVIVVSQGSTNQIQVVGQVIQPQSIAYRDGVKVLDVIVAVGGLTEFAAGNYANLVRQTQSGQVECWLRLDDLMAGDLSQNINLYRGDVLVIPEARF